MFCVLWIDVGKKELIIDLIGELNVKIVENYSYKKDTNILSLTLALEDRISPFYLFEADCIFEDKCFDSIFDNSLELKINPHIPHCSSLR